MEDSEIEKIGKNIGGKIPKEFILFCFKEIITQSFLEYIALLCGYGGFAHHKIKLNEGTFPITLVDDLGYRWSLFLNYVIEEGIIITLKVRPQLDISEMSVAVKWRDRV